MKQYKLKMSRDCWSSDRKPKRDKTFNSAERWRGKREVAAELQDPETSQWREKAIKEHYEKSYRVTVQLAYTLQRLGIGVIHTDDQPWIDISDFVEEVVKPPKGWQWWRGSIEKV